MTPVESKKKLREEIKSIGSGIPQSQRAMESVALCKKIRQQRDWLYAESVLMYAPLTGEVDIWPLAQESIFFGRAVFLPRFDAEKGVYQIVQVKDLEKDIKPGKFGVREPAPENPRSPRKQLDLILVPGLGFSMDGGRLGRGGGYYDRLVAELDGPACGVAFDWQILEGIPMESQDRYMNLIVTPTLWHAVQGRRGASR